MSNHESPEGVKRQTIETMSDTLFLLQEMARRLAHGTHGQHYDSVRELNERLHHSRLQLYVIESSLPVSWPNPGRLQVDRRKFNTYLPTI
jgi:hypothetical protein